MVDYSLGTKYQVIYKLPVIFFFFHNFFFFLQLYPPIGISPMGNRVAFPGESQLRQSRATQPTVHAGRFGVSIVHRTLTWTTESLTCAQMLMHAVAHWGVKTV